MKGNAKLLSLATAYTVASAGAALGADLPVTPVATEGYAGPENNFGGLYLGVGYGVMAGELGYDEYRYAGDTEGAFTVFGGYNFVFNDWVIGGDVAWWSDTNYNSQGVHYGFDGLVDLRLRVGYTFASMLPVDNIMFYGSVGWFQVDYEGWGGGGYDGTADGWSLGGGIEANVTDRFFVGADVNWRWDTDDGNNNYSKFHAPLTTVAIRGGFRLWQPQQ